MNPSVSVVIPTHQRPVYLDRAIQSVLKQSHKNCQIIVVDDNGKGAEHQLETQSLMQRYGDNPNIQYVVMEQNLGGSAARNAGIAHSESDYIGFLDDDDEWMAEFVSRHLDVFAQSDADIVYCGYQRIHDDDNTVRSESVVNHRGLVFDQLLRGWCPTSTSLFMLRRSSLTESAIFDERFPSFQDYDCWLGLARTHQFDYCDDELMLKHGHGVGQISVNPVTRQKGLEILEQKWRGKLNESEWSIFKDTLSGFQKELYRKEFLIARQSNGILASLPKAAHFLSFDIPTVREIARVAKNLIFPYR